jgi:hypothetical protein
MVMDPNKRGNPPFEPSSYAAGLERRVKRHETWAGQARLAAKRMLDGSGVERTLGEQWWRDQLNQPEAALSSPTPNRS